MAISIIRIDDRLIHGQVVMTWVRHLQCSHIKIVDDKTANDQFMVTLLNSVAPNGIDLEILTVEEAVKSFSKWEISDEIVMIIVRTPLTLKSMSENSINFKSINLGGLAIGPERKKFLKNIAMSLEEKDFILSQVNSGVDVYYQMIATERRVPLTEKMFT